MIAVDTNVVVRLLTGDEPKQLERARKVFATETIFLPKTVMLETEWVLRSLYGHGHQEIARALSGLVSLPQVHSEDADTVIEALEWLRLGLDFADAVHLASSRMATLFVTFDRALVRRAKMAANCIAVTAP